MDWYYVEGRERADPISETDFRALFAAGRLGPETLVWHAGMAGWECAASVDGGPFSPAVSNQSVCTECGRAFAPEDVLNLNRLAFVRCAKTFSFNGCVNKGLPQLQRAIAPAWRILDSGTGAAHQWSDSMGRVPGFDFFMESRDAARSFQSCPGEFLRHHRALERVRSDLSGRNRGFGSFTKLGLWRIAPEHRGNWR